MDFKKSFCCGFNLNNDEITSVLCKHVMLRFVTTSRSENRCGKWLFFCLKLRVSIWRTGRHTPTKNSLEYPPGGEAEEFMCFASPTQSDITVSLVFICCLVYSSDIRTSSWLQSSSKLHGTCFEKFYLPLVLFKFNDRGHSWSQVFPDVIEKKIYTILSLLLLLLLFMLYYNFLSHIYIQIINNKTKKDTKVTKLSLILYMNKRGKRRTMQKA